MNDSEEKINEIDYRTSEQQKNKSRKGCLIIVLIAVTIILCSFFFLIFFVITLFFSSDISFSDTAFRTKTSLKQIYVSGNKDSQNKIAVIYINGIIQNNGFSWGKTANVKELTAQIKEVAKDKKIKAVIFCIDSPGGEATVIDILHHNMEKVRKKKPVVALLGAIAASGGYYIAVASDCIIANRLTTTGNIGTIINNCNYYKLFEKIGVQDEVYKSKEMKDILNPARPRTKNEEVIIQALINESYNDFVSIVSKGAY